MKYTKRGEKQGGRRRAKKRRRRREEGEEEQSYNIRSRAGRRKKK